MFVGFQGIYGKQNENADFWKILQYGEKDKDNWNENINMIPRKIDIPSSKHVVRLWRNS